jgi:hypothetical protein
MHFSPRSPVNGPERGSEFDSIIVRGTKRSCSLRHVRSVFHTADDDDAHSRLLYRCETGHRDGLQRSAAFQAGLRDGDEVTNQVDPCPRRTEPVVLEIGAAKRRDIRTPAAARRTV